MTPDEIREMEQQMDTLAREYGATHDPKILEELKELSRQLRESEEKTNTVEGEAPMSSERGPGEPTVLRLLQNERVDVVRMISQPGDKGLGKPRTDRVLYVINGAKVRFHYPDGRTEDAVWKTGDVIWAPADARSVENIDNTELDYISVHLK